MRRTTRALWPLMLLTVLLSLACAGDGPAIDGEVAVVLRHEEAPLARVLEFVTTEPAVASITVSNGERDWQVPTSEGPQTTHSIPILGMRAGTRHTASIDLRGDDGRERARAAVVELETAPLPDSDFPPLAVGVSEPDRMEPGLTLLSAIRWLERSEDLANGWIVVVDAAGEVVWYYHAPHRIVDVRQTSRRTYIYLYNDGLVEIDGLGNIIAQWYATGLGRELTDGVLTLDTDVLHHQVEEQPSGEILTLGSEVRSYDNYPSHVSDRKAPRETANVVATVVLLMKRDGKLAGEWKLLDILDPYRVSYGGLGRFWNREGYGGLEGGTRDWGHANGAIVDPRDGNIIVTVRHQDAVVKFDRDGQLVWILGDPARWGERFRPYLLEREGNFEWPYHMHAPQITPAGNLMLFDNGNFRAIPPRPPTSDAESYTRIVELDIDEEAMTVRQVWEYRGPEGETFYSPFMGDADRLPETGNVLITDGGRLVDANGAPTSDVLRGRKWARVVEVTGGADADVVFELTLDAGEDAENTTGWSFYQGDRIEGLW